MSEDRVERSAERLKFFTDAVVAIAMTLLILPLLESVSEAAAEGFDTSEYLHEHGGQLFAFVLSFVIIATFWLSHERLFAHVERWSSWLMILNIAWMLTIVFLPVATALVGSMEVDRPQVAVYIGTMVVSTSLMASMNLLVRRSPETWGDGKGPEVGGLAAQVGLVSLFVLALVLGVAFPSVNYYALLVLFASGPLQARLRRVLVAREG